MKTVYRYPITEAINDIQLPIGAKVLKAGITKDRNYVKDEEHFDIRLVETDTISIWAEVDTDAHTETRRFLVFGTGADMSETTNFETFYIGTVQKKNSYAFHVYEVINK